MPRRDSVALRHLSRALDADFTSRLPTTADLVALQEAVRAASEGAFSGWTWEDGKAVEVLARADAVVAGVIAGESDAEEVARTLDDARGAVEPLATRRNRAAAGIRALLDALASRHEAQGPPGDPTGRKGPAETGLAVEVAVRWLSHGGSLTDSAARFRDDAATQPDRWATRLIDYADALDRAADTMPRRELERVVRTSSATDRDAEAARQIDEAIYRGAGFTYVPADPLTSEVPLRELLALPANWSDTRREPSPSTLRASCARCAASSWLVSCDEPDLWCGQASSSSRSC
ncbi:MAG: hypothetical protein ACRDM0_02680 [Thermoleophilaceae bacterium]